MATTGKLQRITNPLPRGVYWQDFFTPAVGGASIAEFEAWLRINRDKVKVRASEYHGPGTNPALAFMQGAWTLNAGLAAIANELPSAGTERLWALFEVLEPVVWPATAFGFPTIASSDTVESDTVQKPPPEREGFELISRIGEQVAEGVARGAGDLASGIVGPVLVGVGAVLGIAWLLKIGKS